MRIRTSFLFLLAMCFAAGLSFGQGVTTANMSGSVMDKEGSPLPGAVIEAVHEPTGTRYTTVTRADGRYAIRNMRVGGPYAVTASMTGFKSQKEDNIFLKLGENKEIVFTLQLDSVEETLVVVGSSNELINPSKTGAASNVSSEMIETLPTIARGIEDYARTNPFFNTSDSNGGATSLSVAGRNNRFNSVLIDGAVNNDLFGLAANGNPGGQAEAQPISIEAIQEIQLVVAPYDIRQGGFTGGGVNAVTKSGTNEFSGTLFSFTRDQDFVGDIDNREFGTFSEDQTGLTVGGPIVKDKAFFFFSAEVRRRDRPTGWAIRGDGQSGSGQNFGRSEEATIFRDILVSQYGYDPGSFDEQTRNTDSDNYFIRFDFNINDYHQLTVRHNYIDAENLINFPGSFTFRFPNNAYTFQNETNSTVVQLNSTIGSAYNEFRFSYQTIKDQRAGIGEPFPWIEIENLPGGGEFEVGTERFSTQNALDQDILEITNDLTFFWGNHTVTFGTHNEIFSFDNLFIRENFGAYQFNSLDDFVNGWAEQYDYSFSATNDPQQSAKFDAMQLGFYVGDQWAVKPNLNVTMGLRVDIPLFPDDPTRNPVSEENFGLRTDTTADGNLLISPRFGFNWDINDDGKRQLRGGIGVFAGRTPYVWLSNQYSNTGIEFTRIRSRVSGGVSADNHIPFNPDINNQPTDLGFGFTNEIDLIDPDFELPQLLRWNMGYDHQFDYLGLVGTAEFIWSKTLNDILYQNLNIVPSGETNSFDGRPQFERLPNNLSDVIFLTNHSDGDQLLYSFKLDRPWNNNWFASVSYTGTDSETKNDGTSSQAISNWRNNEVPADPSNPPLSTSDFEVEHRFNAAFSYRLDWQGSPLRTTLSFFYNVQSGRPYSTVYNGDANGDGQFGNDLMYVPVSESEIILTGGTWAQFNAYIEADEGLRNARGRIVERNASREPWRRSLDFKVAQDVMFKKYQFQVTLDVFNLLNVFFEDAGEHRFVRFNSVNPVRYRGIDSDTGLPRYQLQFTDPDARFQTDDLRSRWQAQLGLRFSF